MGEGRFTGRGADAVDVEAFGGGFEVLLDCEGFI